MRATRLALTAVSAAMMVLATALPGQAAPPGDPGPFRSTTYRIVPAGAAADDVFPEGIATGGRFFYHGSTTDGTVYRGRIAGRRSVPFLPGGRDNRTSVTGMKVSRGVLYVAGAATGRVFAYNLATRRLVGSWLVAPTGAPTFLNDITIGRNGSVYVTDSNRPVLYRIPAGRLTTNGVRRLPVFVNFTGSPLQYTTGTNVNGIATSADGRFLVLSQSNLGQLFRVRISDKAVTRVRLGGATVAGDGLVLSGRTLFAIERQGTVGYVVKTRLGPQLGAGTVVSRTTYAAFADPTTAARVGDRLLVVNSQFGRRGSGQPLAPFTIANVPLP
jgi:sugar lactone lactonase YvrE